MNEIDLDKIDLMQPPPEHEPERQYYFMAKCREYVRAESQRLGRPLFCATITFGCQMNARDSEKLAGILREIGYELVDSEASHSNMISAKNEASSKGGVDFIIFNTCTVRDNANQRVYGRGS